MTQRRSIPDRTTLTRMYELMLQTRMFEERLMLLHQEGRAPGVLHPSIGQEAIGVGTVAGLESDDVVIPSLRNRAAFFAKGSTLREMMAADYLKDSAPARGKETAHHMGDPAKGILVGSGVLAASVPVAVGAALSFKLRRQPNVALVTFGDGASNLGDVHEAMNLAAVLDLPVIFVIENNQIALSTPVEHHSRSKNLADRAAGYGMAGEVVDGTDVVAVYSATQRAIARARAGEGPSLLEVRAYRWLGHTERDDPTAHRSVNERNKWLERCPIESLRRTLVSLDCLDEQADRALREAIEASIEDAIVFAEAAPPPAPSQALTDVYA